MPRPTLPTPGVTTGWGAIINSAVNSLSDLIDGLTTSKADLSAGKLVASQLPTHSQPMSTISDAGAVGRNVLAADSWSTGLTALGIGKPVVWCDYTDNARPTLPANALLIVRGGSLAQAPTWMIDDDWYLERTT